MGLATARHPSGAGEGAGLRLPDWVPLNIGVNSESVCSAGWFARVRGKIAIEVRIGRLGQRS
jgi:hypothetical protein